MGLINLLCESSVLTSRTNLCSRLPEQGFMHVLLFLRSDFVTGGTL